MTCIAAISQRGQVWMGGDSASSDGYTITTLADPKVFKVGAFLLGVCGSFRHLQLLRYSFQPPEQLGSETDQAYVVVRVVPVLRKLFQEGGALANNEGVETGGQFLLGYRGALYAADLDWQVTAPAC